MGCIIFVLYSIEGLMVLRLDSLYTRFNLNMENEQADAGRGDRTRLARSNFLQIFKCERGQGNVHFPRSAYTSRTGNLTRLIHTLLCYDHRST